MKRTLCLLLLLAPAVVLAQTNNTFYVSQFRGVTTAEKIAAAQNSCTAGKTCVIVIDPLLPSNGVDPVRCATCVWFDYRSPGSLSITPAVSAGASVNITPMNLSAAADPIVWNIPETSVNTQLALTANRTLNIQVPTAGQTYLLTIRQDATGGRTLTLGTGCTWKVANGGAGALTLSTAANATDVLTFYYDGINCYANLGKNYN